MLGNNTKLSKHSLATGVNMPVDWYGYGGGGKGRCLGLAVEGLHSRKTKI